MLDANVSNKKCHLSLPIKKRKKEKKGGVLIQKKTKKKCHLSLLYVPVGLSISCYVNLIMSYHLNGFKKNIYYLVEIYSIFSVHLLFDVHCILHCILPSPEKFVSNELC